jgi:hypothetical protein
MVKMMTLRILHHELHVHALNEGVEVVKEGLVVAGLIDNVIKLTLCCGVICVAPGSAPLCRSCTSESCTTCV